MLLVALSWPLEVLCHDTKDNQRLSKIGPAPVFTLTNQDGKRLALKELRGKVLAITFIFASCVDTCPLLTAKMAGIQNRLGSDFGPKVFSSQLQWTRSATRRRSSSVCRRHKANSAGWAFLPAHPPKSATSPSATASITKKRRAATWTIRF